MTDGYKVRLELKEDYYPNHPDIMDLEVCSYFFEKEINEINGNVESKAKGGTIHLGLNSLPPKFILQWGMKHKMYDSGRIMIFSPHSDMSIVEEEIRFENAFCVNLKVKYNRYGTSHYTVFLTISAERISIGQTASMVDNRWLNK
ncbi:MAG: hypothetical protein LBV74_13915 [Tannerella sp.]|jgi:hypothetical protein|nr:hypothetical protein [Tannerella sp.]